MSVLVAGNIESRATYRSCPVCLAVASERGPDGALRHAADCKTRTHYYHKGLGRWVKRRSGSQTGTRTKAQKQAFKFYKADKRRGQRYAQARLAPSITTYP